MVIDIEIGTIGKRVGKNIGKLYLAPICYTTIVIYICKCRATRKCAVSYTCYAVWNGNGGECRAVRECNASYTCHAVWNGNGGECVTLAKCISSYSSYVVPNSNGSKCRATIECIVFYTCHVIWNCDRVESAVTECIIRYLNQTIGQDNGKDSLVSIEYRKGGVADAGQVKIV